MNRHLYKVIFNKVRGLLMVVGEGTKNQAKGTGSERDSKETPAASRSRPFEAALRPLYFSVLLALGLVAFVPSHAQIVSSSGGPAVDHAQNGVPVVNINTPSAAGVSHNRYSRFDVEQHGAVLNNSRVSSQTQLAGWLQGNPNLASSTARVILNEVNSQNQSVLRGYLEVAGVKAQVIVANPAGVTCDGCGFINASRATMTTGEPIMTNGRLDGFNVRGGSIRIEGAGLDATRSDYTDLIARSVAINAGIWANSLHITTGTNRVSADNTHVEAVPASEPDTGPEGSAENSARPQVAIDVAHLGGMYANRIVLVNVKEQ